MNKMADLSAEIRNEVYRALILLGAKSDLLSTFASWGSTLPDEDVLACLRGWTEGEQDELKMRIGHSEIRSGSTSTKGNRKS